MTRIFNRASEKEKRRALRKNMTKAEVLLWIQLKNRKLLGQRVLRQYSVGPYVVDFYIPKLKLAIEVDGATHSMTRAPQRRCHTLLSVVTLNSCLPQAGVSGSKTGCRKPE
jgi:very-short-patch-repair endonuclease